MHRQESILTYLIISLDINGVLCVFVQLFSFEHGFYPWTITDILLILTGICMLSGLLAYVDDKLSGLV